MGLSRIKSADICVWYSFWWLGIKNEWKITAPPPSKWTFFRPHFWWRFFPFFHHFHYFHRHKNDRENRHSAMPKQFVFRFLFWIIFAKILRKIVIVLCRNTFIFTFFCPQEIWEKSQSLYAETVCFLSPFLFCYLPFLFVAVPCSCVFPVFLCFFVFPCVIFLCVPVFP